MTQNIQFDFVKDKKNITKRYSDIKDASSLALEQHITTIKLIMLKAMR